MLDLQRFLGPGPRFEEPEHCPHAACPAHVPGRGPAFGCSRFGTYERKAAPRRIQRFRCHVCRRTFSTQSFSADYYMKRPELLVPLASSTNLAQAHRQAAQQFGCHGSSAARLVARIGRHEALFHRAMASDLPLGEAVALDDLETFVTSQLTQLAVAFPVGCESWFVYDADLAAHWWAGRLTRRKRREKRRLIAARAGPARGARRDLAARVVGRLLARSAGTLELVTDGHPVYAALLQSPDLRERTRHRAFPNPPRRRKDRRRTLEERQRDAALYPADQLHRLKRHAAAADRRETIAFPRCETMTLLRAIGFLTWRNYVKRVSERKPHKGTAAMRVGLAPRPLSWEEVFRRRLFPAHWPLDGMWEAAWRCELTTRGRAPSRRHLPAWAVGPDVRARADADARARADAARARADARA